MTVAAVAVLALLGTVLLGLSQQGAGGDPLPRVQDAARGLIDPPGQTTTGTAETGAGATPEASASPAASPAASASPEAIVPATPPPNDDTQAPGQSQYTGGN